MTDLLAIFQFIFLLPLVVVRMFYVIFARFILNRKITADQIGEPKWFYFLSGLIWLAIFIFFVYQSQFKYITYVYACPSGSSSKCYKVRADYVPPDCEDTEWDNRGAHGGRCSDPFIEKIYFENGGYISFEFCDMNSKEKWTCYPDDEKSGTWDLEIFEVVKVKK